MIDVPEEYNIRFWELLIKDLKGAIVFRHRDSKMKTIYAYDGSTSIGGKLREGLYKYELRIYQRGREPLRKYSGKFKVDFTRPISDIRADKTLITPDNDGIDDVVTFDIKAADENEITKCELKITDEKDTPVKAISFNYPVDKFTWNGISDIYRKTAPEGRYVA